jgi:hypothetical protein
MAENQTIALDHVASNIHRALMEYRQSSKNLRMVKTTPLADDASSVVGNRDDKETWTNQLESKKSMIASELSEYFRKEDTQPEYDIVLDNDIDDFVNTLSDSEGGNRTGKPPLDAGCVDDLEISTDVQLTSPEKIAALFSKEAASKLSAHQVCLLLAFLQKSAHVTASELASRVDQELEKFYKAEVEQSGQPRTRLGIPSGPVDAEVGIMLHCQSKEGGVGEFWDPKSKTIEILAEKGFSPDFAYFFDWHFRADETASRDNGRCFANKWPEAQRTLHSQFVGSLLSLLPLKWLIVGGNCAQRGYQRTLQKSCTLLIPLASGTHLEFDLDFTPYKLRRITTYIKHPAAALYSRHRTTSFSGAQDSALNFCLWLLDKKYNPDFISKVGSHSIFTADNCVNQLWAYRKAELESGKIFEIDCFQPSFLRWAA